MFSRHSTSVHATLHLVTLLIIIASNCTGLSWKFPHHPTRWPIRPGIKPGGLGGLLRPTTTVSPAELIDEDYDQNDIIEKPPPGGWVPEDSKIELSLGPCFLHLYEPCANSKLLFYLFHSDAPKDPIYLNTSDPNSLSTSGLSPRLNTKVIIHGYNGSLFYEQTFDIAKAYLDEGGVNVIVLDWSAYSAMPCYPSAVINTWQAGKCTAQALHSMAKWSGIPGRFLNRMHLIGFSLGAHIAGFASSYLRPARIGRITGLDPALPFFASLSRSWKLDASDARFVDVIHTNVGVLGKIDHTGHVDFYVNGGSVQPACNSNRRPLCNHLLAATYFAESIRSSAPGFWGTPCYSFLYYVVGWCDDTTTRRSAVLMGEHCPRNTRGVFFVTTGYKTPFGLGPLQDITLIVEEPQPVEAAAAENSTLVLTPEEEENTQLFLNNTIVFTRDKNSTQTSSDVDSNKI